MPKSTEVFTVSQVSKFLNVGITKAYELCHSKGFPVVQIGRKLLVPRKQLDLWLEEQTTKNNKEM